MATISGPDEFVVYKFESTGLVALCEEVVDFTSSAYAKAVNVDLNSATYRRGPSNEHEVVFQYKPGGVYGDQW